MDIDIIWKSAIMPSRVSFLPQHYIGIALELTRCCSNKSHDIPFSTSDPLSVWNVSAACVRCNKMELCCHLCPCCSHTTTTTNKSVLMALHTPGTASARISEWSVSVLANAAAGLRLSRAFSPPWTRLMCLDSDSYPDQPAFSRPLCPTCIQSCFSSRFMAAHYQPACCQTWERRRVIMLTGG